MHETIAMKGEIRLWLVKPLASGTHRPCSRLRRKLRSLKRGETNPFRIVFAGKEVFVLGKKKMNEPHLKERWGLKGFDAKNIIAFN
jgi:hypothetical protein